MTSNIGSQYIQDLGAKDYEEMRRRVLDALRVHFKPEFLNRVDEVIIFHALTLEDIKQIVEIQLRNLRRRLAERKISLVLTDQAKEFLAQEGFDPVYGARPLKRAIQRFIQDPLALKLLEGEFSEGDTVEVDVSLKNEMVFSKPQAKGRSKTGGGRA
jgi:ATP-dependent Clp protease ATP-binding subunit ClpB